MSRLARYLHETYEALDTLPENRTERQKQLVLIVLANSKISCNEVFKSEVK